MLGPEAGLLQPQPEAGEDQVGVSRADPIGVQLPETVDLQRHLRDARRPAEQALGDPPEALARLDDARGAAAAAGASALVCVLVFLPSLLVRTVAAPPVCDRHLEGERPTRGGV